MNNLTNARLWGIIRQNCWRPKMNLHVEQISINLIWYKIQSNCESMWIKKWIALYFTPNCKTQNPWSSLVPNPWASLVPPLLSKRMRAFQNQRKFMELQLEGVSVTWLVEKANVRVHFFGSNCIVSNHWNFVATFSSSSHKKDCRKTTITLHQGQLYTRD